MRALLVINQKATTTSERSRDVLVRALRSAVTLEVAVTRRRGHATTLAEEAASAGHDLVVVHGGDGTVNEVVNGLMRVGGDAAARPALSVVPGGSTNVFARAVGVPGDWPEATGVILEALREGRHRLIGLGRTDQRYFTFCAGLGIDAAVVRQVERARLRGRTSTPGLYLRAAGARFLRAEQRQAGITLETDDAHVAQLATVIVQNTAPWTYLWGRPVDPNPQASFDLGLDVMALRSLGPATTVRTAVQLLSRRPPGGARVYRWHDLSALRLGAQSPQPFQIDGEYLGEHTEIKLFACPEALRVVC